jgi:undecaprenyl-diphosphatase
MDISIFFLINRGMANPFFDLLMPVLSARGYLLVLPFLIYHLFRASKTRDASGRSRLADALWVIAVSVVSVVFAGMAESFLKPAIGRVRPCHVLEGVRLLGRCIDGFSMPSGHALSSFAFAAPLVYLTRNTLSFTARLYPLTLAALIAFSRVYLGVHYPTDTLPVLVGCIAGASDYPFARSRTKQQIMNDSCCRVEFGKVRAMRFGAQ